MTGAITVYSANVLGSGATGAILLSTGTTANGNSGDIIIGSAKAKGGHAGSVSFAVGDSAAGVAGAVYIAAGSASVASVQGGDVKLLAGGGVSGGTVGLVAGAGESLHAMIAISMSYGNSCAVFFILQVDQIVFSLRASTKPHVGIDFSA